MADGLGRLAKVSGRRRGERLTPTKQKGGAPRPGPAPGEGAGHLHPCAKLARGRAGIRRRAFLTDGQRLVLPAFGAYAGGLNVRDSAFATLFSEPPLVAAMGERRVHPLPWDALS